MTCISHKYFIEIYDEYRQHIQLKILRFIIHRHLHKVFSPLAIHIVLEPLESRQKNCKGGVGMH